MNVCLSCAYSIEHNEPRHCFGAVDYCECECKNHAFSADDIRMNLIALFTAEAHGETELLKQLIGSLEDDDARTLLLLNVQFNVWMLRQAGLDPVEHVQEAALYWQGGGTNVEPDEAPDDDGGDDGSPQ